MKTFNRKTFFFFEREQGLRSLVAMDNISHVSRGGNAGKHKSVLTTREGITIPIDLDYEEAQEAFTDEFMIETDGPYQEDLINVIDPDSTVRLSEISHVLEGYKGGKFKCLIYTKNKGQIPCNNEFEDLYKLVTGYKYLF